MKQRQCKKWIARVMSMAAAVVMLAPVLPFSVSARENGRTVLEEDYYGLTDSNSAKVSGLIYRCSKHGSVLKEYYVEEENDYAREVPGIIERNGNKIRYVGAYYCPDCYARWVNRPRYEGDMIAQGDDYEEIPNTVAGYFEFLSLYGSATGAYGEFYQYPPEDDLAHAPRPDGEGNGGNTWAAPLSAEEQRLLDEGYPIVSRKALPEPSAKQPDTMDPLSNWDKNGAFAFYTFYYTGINRVINIPASADDPAWETVNDMTRLYWMDRQKEGQISYSRIDRSGQWYNFDYSMMGDWRITDLMAEYATGELCGYATYVGTESEVAVPETVNIPIYGKVKIVGLDLENHFLSKIYVNDNVTCIRRLSSVNLTEISGCKNLEYIEKYAFQNDVLLSTLPEMPKLDWIAMGAFEGCVSLRDINLPDHMTFIDFTAFGWYDTVLGNYDIGMTDQSWEDFQYLSDLSDDDKIYGITLYAKEGSTTYTLLDALINKNDALTPDLDEDGNPYFRSYGDRVAAMSGDVRNYTGHWTLKSSGDYKGAVASSDKDVDDSTWGRLGEYGEGEPSWSPIDGAITGGLLFGGLVATGLAESKKKKKEEPEDIGIPMPRKETEYDPETEYWGIKEVYDDLEDADKAKQIFDILDAFSDKIEKMGKLGKVGKQLIVWGKAAQKAADVYADTGDWMLALKQARDNSFGLGKLMDQLTDAVPVIGKWDMISGLILGNSKAADAISVGANMEHLADFYMDMRRTVENTLIPGYNKGTVFTVEEMRSRLMDGSYGENLQNLAWTVDMANAESVSQIWNGIFGADGMGFSEFINGVCDTATAKTTDNSLVSGYLRELFNNTVEHYYETH